MGKLEYWAIEPVANHYPRVHRFYPGSVYIPQSPNPSIVSTVKARNKPGVLC